MVQFSLKVILLSSIFLPQNIKVRLKILLKKTKVAKRLINKIYERSCVRSIYVVCPGSNKEHLNKKLHTFSHIHDNLWLNRYRHGFAIGRHVAVQPKLLVNFAL